ncbi:MAG: PAS domain-containing protein, partial [Gammaproteobacteria bacterium]|nr:PAS domain-containing protein [Gammaproteobacteria bacterium]
MFGIKKSSKTPIVPVDHEMDLLKAEHAAILRTQAVAVCTPDGLLASASEAFAAALGHAVSDLRATPFATLIAHASERSWRDAWSALLGGRPVVDEFECNGKDGRRWLRISACPIAGDGAAVGKVLCFATDVT